MSKRMQRAVAKRAAAPQESPLISQGPAPPASVLLSHTPEASASHSRAPPAAASGSAAPAAPAVMDSGEDLDASMEALFEPSPEPESSKVPPSPPSGSDSSSSSGSTSPSRSRSPKRPSHSRGHSTGAHALAGQDDARQMARAQDLIHKYKLPGPKRVLHPSLVGFDTANRDGVPLSGERCDQLLHEIELMGWDADEANFGNICVEERPGHTDLFRFNKTACAAQEFLADIATESLAFGTLSHSHLHQCLKNIAGGAPAVLPVSFMNNGRLCLHTVRSHSLALAESVENGLSWTVLSWRIRDEPGAMELIQSAQNRKSGVAMKAPREPCIGG